MKSRREDMLRQREEQAKKRAEDKMKKESEGVSRPGAKKVAKPKERGADSGWEAHVDDQGPDATGKPYWFNVGA